MCFVFGVHGQSRPSSSSQDMEGVEDDGLRIPPFVHLFVKSESILQSFLSIHATANTDTVLHMLIFLSQCVCVCVYILL
jgi:hypothetical protein